MPKTYYWLKLKSDFFTSRVEIKKLWKQAGGDKYIIIYLRLLLLSMPSDGYIYYEGVEKDLASELALLLDLYPDDAAFVVAYLLKTGLMLKISDSEYFLPQSIEMMGKECDSAERVRKYREKKSEALQCNKDVTQKADKTPEKRYIVTQRREEIEKELELDIDIDNNIEQNEQKKETYAEAFDKLWESYPRKIGKKRAFEAYKRAIKSGTTDEAIADGIERYRQYVESRKFEEKYIKQGSTWFAGECWNDEYDISARQFTADEERDYQELWGD